ncbi:hypothetical protein PBY51_009052 [Eleginops maclovinus]|uniref:Uncharacterized protein n=1 Tax=Eleginops maclovinus TaxID=56733 RepID=A0AAN7WU99_ELEMC|nr:hypothetical protein PBY51_009052 [Eleginops maclovinus]
MGRTSGNRKELKVRRGRGAAAMLTKKPGTSVLPTGKAGEPVYSPGHSGSQTTSPVALPRLRNSNHNALTGGSKAVMSEAVQLSSQVHVTQLYEENSNKRPVLTSQPNGLNPLGSSRPGPPDRSDGPPPLPAGQRRL